MTTPPFRFLTGGIIALVTLTLNPATVGQTDASSSLRSASRDLSVASKQDLKRSADKLAGEKLTAQDGKKLGSIKDFLVEADSGRLRFAVVSTGGFVGVGDTLHLVPFYMLRQAGDERGFTASITPDMLSRAPKIDEEAFEENRVAVDAQQEQLMADTFSASGANVKSSLGIPGRLIRATKLAGRDVMANGATLGSIQGVVIERGATHALAVFKPAHRIASGDRKFLVPISRLKIGAGKGAAVTTTLSAADFQAVQPAPVTASDDRDGARDSLSTRQSSNVAGDATSGTTAAGQLAPHRVKDQAPTPTGRTSAEQNLGAAPALVSAAHSIREALDADSSLAHANVQVTPQEGRVVVHGTVDSDQEKAAIEHTAANAASDTNIDFDLTVREQ